LKKSKKKRRRLPLPMLLAVERERVGGKKMVTVTSFLFNFVYTKNNIFTGKILFFYFKKLKRIIAKKIHTIKHIKAFHQNPLHLILN